MKTNRLAPLAFLLALCSFFPAAGQIQTPLFGKQHLINGYAKALRGETLSYFSVYPKYAKEALLTRCTDGKKAIEWETDVIPANARGAYAYFTWIAAHSTGTSGGMRHFDLYINDQPALTFSTRAKHYPGYWTFAGKDSTRLVFELKTRDGAEDAHGMAYLRVPLAGYPKGKALKLKVVGQSQGSNDWYMTFKYSFKEKIDVAALPFLLKDGRQPLRFTVLHFGKPARLDIAVNGSREKPFAVQNGFNVLEVPVAAVKERTTLKIRARIGGILEVEKDLLQKPVTFREINLVHHSHTDIGYSHIQEEVERIHVNNIKRALDLIDKTRDYPEGSRFIWNIESAWAVENFLRQAGPEDRQRFFAAVKEGRIAVAATYANVLTGLCSPEEMGWLTEYARSLRDTEGIPVNTAMITDIPGMSWSMVQAMAQAGVRYYSNGPNYMDGLPDKGDRIGYTLRAHGDRPFWWKSPSGRDSILMWICGRGYSSWHGFAQGSVWDRGAEKIAGYLNDLDSTLYPYTIVQWRYNIGADNGPVDSAIAGFVRDWNEKYSSPTLVLANVSELFRRFEQVYGKSLPVLSGDFTPYWEDGAYSTAAEEAENRLLSQKLLSLEQVARRKNIAAGEDLWWGAKKHILLFHEHTWGSWNSVSNPDDPFSTHQWAYKKGLLDSARYYVGRVEEAVLKHNGDASQITVINPLGWDRSGYVEIEGPAGFRGGTLTDEWGRHTPVQLNANGRLGFVALNVPANGEKAYRFSPDAPAEIPPDSPLAFQVDDQTGAIRSLRTLGKEWVNPQTFKGLLQAVYVKGLDPGHFSLPSFKKMEWVEKGAVLRRVRITAGLEGANEVVYEISQYAGLDYLQLSVIIDKKAVRDKEAVHIAFPFAIEQPAVRIGIGETYITPEHGQIPGANKDFFSVQRWLDVSGREAGVTLSCPQGALFEVGGMINEERVNNGYKKWKEQQASSPDIFLYAMNNYWHTNYKADQEGKVRFDFYLSFHGVFDGTRADRFGYEMTQPLLGCYRDQQ